MSTSGTLTSYYVDSLILPESEELSAPRYPSAPGGLQQSRQPASINDHNDIGTCTFSTKASVFSPSWSHVQAPFPGSVYHHHYGHHHQGSAVSGDSDARYMQSWLLEPMSGCLPMSGLQASHNYGIKPEGLAAARGDGALPGSHTALLLSDYANGTVATSPVEKDAPPLQGGDIKGEGDDKPPVDPSKSSLSVFPS